MITNKKFKLMLATILTLSSSLITATNLSAQDYEPTTEQKNAYDICAKYVKDESSLQVIGKSYKQQKKVYTDFLKDYNDGNCGIVKDDADAQSFDINAPALISDPFTNQKIYEGEKMLNAATDSNTAYQKALKKIKVKIEIINKFLVTNSSYTTWDEISTVLQKLYDYKFSSKLSISTERKKLVAITKQLKVQTKYKKITSKISIQTRYYVIGTIVITILTVFGLIVLKIKRK